MENIQYILQILDIAVKLILAVLCGGLLGLHPNRNVNLISMPFSMIIGFTSAFVIIIFSRLIAAFSQGMYGIEIIIAPVIIGFAIIGSAVIIGQKGKLNSIGQALIIWIIAGIGMLIGSGLYLIGVVTGIICFIIINIIYKFIAE